MIPYLIWDFDDTLGYRDGGKWTGTLLEILQDACPELPVGYEQLKSYLRVGYPWHTPDVPHPELDTPEKWWTALMPVLAGALTGVGVPPEQAAKLARQFPARYTALDRWRLFPDTMPVLEKLAEAGYRHILLTNHVPELPAILDHLGLPPLLAAVHNSAQTGVEKPNPRAFRAVLDAHGPAAWMIGDNYTADIRGAAALGIPGILVRKTHPEAPYCCAGLGEVAEIILRERVAETPR